MLSNLQLVEQLTLQDRLNKVVNPEWRTAGYNWTRAIMVEGVEALDHLGWKWWKKYTSDMPQFHIELVDIWHFALSKILEGNGGDIHTAAGEIRAAYRAAVPLMGEDLTLHEALHRLVADAARGEFYITTFNRLIGGSDFSWQALHRMYLGKNVLNLFRQANGYKAGTYIKDWGGMEDNVVLAALMDSRPDATADQLLAQLGSTYSKLTKEKA